MAEFINHYTCSECGEVWQDQWSCTCDDRCPNCNTSISPTHSEELIEEAEAEEETEEEHAVRLRRISDEVKADIKAGRYRHGQLHPNITAKQEISPRRGFLDSIPELESWQKEIMALMMTKAYGASISGRMIPRERPPFHEMYGGLVGKRPTIVVMDECHHIKPQDYWLGYSRTKPEKSGSERDGPKGSHWDQPIPEKGAETPPSNAKRAKLRAKRKRKK